MRGYHQLLAVLRARKEVLGMSDKDLEHIAELTPGHWSKIVAGVKSLGPLSMGKVLRALSLELVAHENAASEAELRELYLPRVESQVRKMPMHTAAVHVKLTRKFFRKIGAKGGTNSRRNIGKRQRRKLARKAAAARWQKPSRRRQATA